MYKTPIIFGNVKFLFILSIIIVLFKIFPLYFLHYCIPLTNHHKSFETILAAVDVKMTHKTNIILNQIFPKEFFLQIVLSL